MLWPTAAAAMAGAATPAPFATHLTPCFLCCRAVAAGGATGGLVGIQERKAGPGPRRAGLD